METLNNLAAVELDVTEMAASVGGDGPTPPTPHPTLPTIPWGSNSGTPYSNNAAGPANTVQVPHPIIGNPSGGSGHGSAVVAGNGHSWWEVVVQFFK